MRSIQWLGLIVVALLVASTSPVLGYGVDWIGGSGDANDAENWLDIPAQGYYGMYWNDNGYSTHVVPTVAWAQFPPSTDANQGKVFIRNGGSATIGSGVELGCRDTWCVGGFEIKYAGVSNAKFLNTSSSLLIQTGGSLKVQNSTTTFAGKFDAGTKYTGTITNYGNVTVGSTQLGGTTTYWNPDADEPNTKDDGTSTVRATTGTLYMKGGLYEIKKDGLTVGGNGGNGYFYQDAGTMNLTGAGSINVGHKATGGSIAGTGVMEISGGSFLSVTTSESRIGACETATQGQGTGTVTLSNSAYMSLTQTSTKQVQVGVTTNAAAGSDGVGLVTVKDTAILNVGTGDGTTSLAIGLSTAVPTGAGRGKGKVEVLNTGTLLAAKQVQLGRNSGQGTFKVGKDATVVIGGVDMATNATATSVARLEVEIGGAADFSQIDCNDGAFVLTAALGTRQLYVASSAYRPYEGQTFDVLTNAGIASNNTVSLTVSTDLTVGSAGFSAANFATDASHEVLRVTFTGLTAGDCDGSHGVNGGDLAIMGTYWNQTGKAWADGDFNGDGAVNGGDLAMMGSFWNWSAAAPPAGGEVPEPATLTLLGLGGLALIRRKR